MKLVVVGGHSRNIGKTSLDGVGLPQHQLGLGVVPWDLGAILLMSNSGPRRRVELGEPVRCVDEHGVEREVVFTSPAPDSGDPLDDEPTVTDPDFFRRRRYED